jgi:hypothetical protein
MSKVLFGNNFANRDPASSSTKTRDQQEQDQVSALYELGLLGGSDKKTRRREKGKDKDIPSGARVAGPPPKKGALPRVC